MYGPAAALVWLSFVGCDITLTVVALCLAMGLNAGMYTGYLVRNIEMLQNLESFHHHIFFKFSD